MINSLLKDSHITQSTCRPKSHPSERSAQSGRSRSVSLYSSNISVNKKTAEPSFSGFFSSKDVTKPAGIYTKQWVKNMLEKAADKPAVFNALFAIGLTCIMRPAAIMALPGEKKNADDKKYAAAQSIASGVIGYLISLAILEPVGNVVKLVIENPGKYLSEKGKKILCDKEAKDITKKYLSMLPDTILAAPRAVVTVALIPPILKHVFGWEKKKKAAKIEPTPVAKDSLENKEVK